MMLVADGKWWDPRQMGFNISHFQYLKRDFLLSFGRNAEFKDKMTAHDCRCHTSLTSEFWLLLSNGGGNMSEFVFILVLHIRVLMKTGCLCLSFGYTIM